MPSNAEDNEYERLRAAKIAENRAKLAQLGLVEASRALMTTVQGPGVTMKHGSEVQPRKKRRAIKEPEPANLEPTRQSRRLRGDAAPSLQQAAAVAQQEAAEEEALGRTRKGTSRKRLTLDPNTAYVAPFTLWSIGVTVWELGQIHRGAWAHRFWSSSGCLFHHAYPVGYRASKVQFGRTYEMTIEAGPTGPIFKVTDQKTGVSFSGESPTKPWTDVCLAHKTGQRISGPLFFGFSDLITQRAIAGLYSSQELQAALQGERLASEAQSAEERAAREFQAVEGIGETTAMALAYTRQLGGAQHASLAALRGWVKESEANQAALRDFLLSSSEMPEATRKWPAWRLRMVPKILPALAGDEEIDTSSAAAKAGKSRAERGRGRAAAAAATTAGDAEEAGAASGSGEAAEGLGVEQQERSGGGGHSAAVGNGGRAAAARGKAGRGSTAGAAVGQAGGGRAKENQPGNSARAGAAAAGVAGAAASLRPGRQRKANSRYQGDYLIELGE